MKLIEWLAGEKAQQMHADLNFEYPIRAGVPINPTIAAFGKLNPDPTPLAAIAEKTKAAANLLDKVGFDN
jgi:iron(III) transport system substrate-binding protein